MKDFPKKYKAAEVEKKWQEFWHEKNIYRYDASASREETYVIDTPPPTVSGMLHMGHVFSYTQADYIARYQRMKGKTVFYPMGFDDNGLPTERLVEKVKKIKGTRMERSEFVSICKQVVKDAEEDFRELFKTIALSVDWEEEYQTISDKTRLISQLSFLDLYEKGLLARRNEPCYYDCFDQTALAQADLEDKELDSSMNEIAFSLDGSEDKIIIATTRPELLPACVAVFVHPEDERYKDLIGKQAITALFKVKVPIIADEQVEKDKGTGAVMCCTFGDVTDIHWWKTHKLKTRVLLNKRGVLRDFFTEDSFDFDEDLLADLAQNTDIEKFKEAYQILVNKKVAVARVDILSELAQQNLLLKTDKISHPVKCAERSGKPVEILVTPQWFIKVLDYKDKLLEKAQEANWYPPYMQIRIEQWINNLSWDWCISRQRFFGVPFPVWYVAKLSDDGQKPAYEEVLASAADLPLDPLYSLPPGHVLLNKQEDGSFLTEKDGEKYHVIAEYDVMDTWATSSVTPQISSRAINQKYADDFTRHQKLFPADLRPQAHEIIRSWAFYTMVKAMHHEDQLPWYNLMISGWCLAADKTKMSKSKGNVVTPTNLISEKGADIVRYWASTSHLGSDTAYSEAVLTVGKKLITKLWNVAKFASLNFSKLNQEASTVKQDIGNKIIFAQTDIWILSKLAKTISLVEAEFERYEYAKARDLVENFFWNDFCDNYLEIVKARSYGDLERMRDLDPDISEEMIAKYQQSALCAVSHVLENILKLFAPFVPHIAEELYDIIYSDKSKKLVSLHARGSWPDLCGYRADENLIALGDAILAIIAKVRKEKSDRNLALNSVVEKLEVTISDISNFTADSLLDIKAVNNAVKLVMSEGSELSVQVSLAS